MSDYSTNTIINLSVNGRLVEDKISKLQKKLTDLQKVATKAIEMGDKGTLQKTQKEIIKVENQMRKVRTATSNVENTLKNLDKARPNNIKKDLQTLKAQLNGLERGSEAWKKHVANIKLLENELRKINSEMRIQESGWERLNRKLNDWQMSIMGIIAALTGLIMAGRNAVRKFAEMEEEMANTRKYTGMTVDSVRELNEEFKKMDTRTAREKLNELAQEAGRLGKRTKEDVKEYVEAADIINVALVDLGEGATQTIAKLTNIFRVDEELGTKESMLSVGSAVNVLSQNCTASKQYLVEFTQRMAGVGATADMTIPQLLAYGATLDANGQKVEMSASALGKLTMKLFQNPAELAKQVGIDVEKFTETLKRSTNEGLIMFLERIHELGAKDGLAVLSPLFQELGVDGVRMSQVLATLAEHLDMVKWEQEEANKAFNEAKSVMKEYSLFNSTTQAGIDKAKKRIAELGVALGEKLLPVMKHIMTSTSATLRLLNIIVSFIIEYRNAIITATASIVAYTLAVEASNIAFKVQYAWLVVSQAAQKAFATVLATVKTAWVLLRLAMAKIEGNYARVKLLQTELNTAMKANAIGLIIAGVIALVAVMKTLVDKYKEAHQAQEALNNVKRNAIVQAQEEIDKLNTLRAAAKDETLSLKQRQQAVENLNKIIPGYNAQIDETTGKLKESKKALDDYIESLIHQYEVEGAEEHIKEISREIAELRQKKVEVDKEIKKVKEQGSNNGAYVGQIGMTTGQQTAIEAGRLQKKIEGLNKEIEAKQTVIDGYNEVYGEDLKKRAIKQDEDNNNNNNKTNTTTNTTMTTSSKASKDRFEAEKAWREREEALNSIAYATGEKSYIDYTKRIDEIALEFYDKQLQHTDLTADERLKIEGDRAEELIKQQEKLSKKSIEEENTRYQAELAVLKQHYVDGDVTMETYNDAMKIAEMKHLELMKNITVEGSKERVDAEKAYLDKAFANQKKHQQEAERAEERFQRNLSKFKEDFFGDTPTEQLNQYEEKLTWLNLAYAAEIQAAGDNAEELKRIQKAYEMAKLDIMKKYNKEALRENQNFLQNFNDDMQEWLRSDAGQVVMATAQVLIDGMSQIFSQLTSMIQAEVEIQQAAIESRYEKEISLAEGNNYEIQRLEKEKQKQIAKVKNDANKKMYNMQVMEAIAQTAQAAINAYSSAAAVPVVGYILAPIAAAMAVSAGMLQVSNIKKQQQAASSGYAGGGYTPKGPKYKEVGVVHAGEWVASQELLANPRSAAIIQSLDYAQRTNTIGSLSRDIVNEDLSANIAIARSSTKNSHSNADNISKTLSKLNDRLNEPFVTVNTVTGDHGIKKAQEEYDKMINNKNPKRR